MTGALLVLIAGMGMTILPAMRRASIQTQAISKLKQLAKMEEDFHGLGDLGLNPDGTYGSYEQLQTANYIPADIVAEDNISHTAFAFLPYYKITIGRDVTKMAVPPDSVGFAIEADPVGGPPGLTSLFMEEDGEVFTVNNDGTRQILH